MKFKYLNALLLVCNSSCGANSIWKRLWNELIERSARWITVRAVDEGADYKNVSPSMFAYIGIALYQRCCSGPTGRGVGQPCAATSTIKARQLLLLLLLSLFSRQWMQWPTGSLTLLVQCQWHIIHCTASMCTARLSVGHFHFCCFRLCLLRASNIGCVGGLINRSIYLYNIFWLNKSGNNFQ